MADVHLVIQKANASDLVLPSKLSTILAVGGVSIVMASPGTSLYNLMHLSDMGYVIIPENQSAFNNSIIQAIYSDNSLKALNARMYAENCLSQEAILSNFSTQILSSSKIQRSKHHKSKVFHAV